jgi:hypothetical protein
MAPTRVSPEGESAFYASACAGLARDAGSDWDVVGHRGSGILHICHRCASVRTAAQKPHFVRGVQPRRPVPREDLPGHQQPGSAALARRFERDGRPFGGLPGAA